MSLTYVYCLVRSARRPSLRGIPAAMPGGREVRILEIPAQRAAGSADWLIVSTVPEDAYGEEALEHGLQQLEWVAPRALAHEAVVEHFLAAPAVLPMQLFTMFTGDERAVEHVVRDKRRIAAILKRIEGKVEWGLRLTLDPDTKPPVATRRAAGLSRRSSPKASEGGAAYLARKRDQIDLARTRLKKARAEANRMYKAVAREATGARRRTATEQAAPGSRLVLDAAFLVPARRAAAFRAAVSRGARALKGAGLTVSLTGPWPAYNFI